MGLVNDNSATGNVHSDDSSVHSRSGWHHVSHKVVSRSISSLLVVAVVSTLYAAQAADSPQSVKADSTDKPTNQVQLDVVKDSLNDEKQSVNNKKGNDVSNTVNVQSNTSGNTSSSEVHVTVNGQEIPVPQNGTTNKTVTTPGSSTSVNVSNNTTGNGTTFSSSFSSSSLNSFSSSSSINSNFTQSSGAP